MRFGTTVVLHDVTGGSAFRLRARCIARFGYPFRPEASAESLDGFFPFVGTPTHTFRQLLTPEPLAECRTFLLTNTDDRVTPIQVAISRVPLPLSSICKVKRSVIVDRRLPPANDEGLPIPLALEAEPHLLLYFVLRSMRRYTVAPLVMADLKAVPMDAQRADNIVLETISRTSELGPFLAVPHRIYATDPQWVAPLDFEQRQRFSPKNPFFQHARWQGWVARRNGKLAGRITAQIDDLHLERHDDAMGFFGMLEAEDDAEVFAALCNAAEGWLQDRGMRRVRGPYNLHINEEVGLLVDGFSTPPFVMMGHGRPWYGARLAEQGYIAVKDLLAYHVRPDFEAPPVMTRLAERVSDRVVVRPLRRKQLAQEAAIMLEIFNDAWANNWGFVPLAYSDFLDTVKTLAPLMPDEYIQIAEYEGKPAAFIVALPNINEATRDLRGKLLPFGWAKLLWRLKVRHPRTARVPLMGVRQEFQHSRLGPTLAFMVIDAVRKALHARNVTDVEMGWVLEDNDGMRNIIETIGGEAYKRYRIYEKSL